MSVDDQRVRIRKLEADAGLVEAPRKATKADIGSFGIQVVEQE